MVEALKEAVSWLSSALLAGIAAYVALLKTFMSKGEHTRLCDIKQETIGAKLEAVSKRLEDHKKSLDERLDRQGKTMEKVDGKLDWIMKRMIPPAK